MKTGKVDKPSRGLILRWVLIALIFAGMFLILFLIGRMLVCGLAADEVWCRWWPHFSLERIQDLVLSAGPWAVVVSIGLMILHSFVPFPAEFITIANGMVFGFSKGVIVTWFGAMTGAVLAFGLARWLGRPFVLKLLSEKQEHHLEKWVGRLGTDTLLVGRFIPAISFNLMNYGAGLAPVSWRTFLWTTGFGILPMTVLMVWAGERVNEIPLWVWALLVVFAFLSVVIVHALKNLGGK